MPRRCFGDRLVELAKTFDLDSIDPSVFDARYNELPSLRFSDYLAGGLCGEVSISFVYFMLGLFFFGKFGNFGFLTELHNVWHHLSGRALLHAANFLVMLPEAIARKA